MLRQIEIDAVGPRGHELLQPRRALGEVLFQVLVADKELLPQVTPDRRLALILCRASQIRDVIGLDTVKVVLALGVDHSENGVGVGLARDVGDAPIVADDGHISCLLLPAGSFTNRFSANRRRETQKDRG